MPTIRIGVDPKAIKKNDRLNLDLPTIIVFDEFDRRNDVHEVEILGPSRVVYRRDGNPRVAVETDAEVKITKRG